MAEPRILHREHAPTNCPHCGSSHLGRVRREELEVAPVEEPEEADRPVPGLLECRECGTVVQWEP